MEDTDKIVEAIEQASKEVTDAIERAQKNAAHDLKMNVTEAMNAMDYEMGWQIKQRELLEHRQIRLEEERQAREERAKEREQRKLNEIKFKAAKKAAKRNVRK
jgi:hypothetical protein